MSIPRHARVLLLTGAFSVAASLHAGRAAAADPADTARADALFKEGRARMAAGDYATACANIAESQRLDPQLGTLMNLAGCFEAQGKVASAWMSFNEAAAWASRALRPDREKTARERARALESRVPHLVLRVQGSARLTVSLDAKPLAADMLGTPIPIDPGDHVLEARGPGAGEPWRKAIHVDADPESQSVTIPSLEDPRPPPPVRPAGPHDPATGPSPGGTATAGAIVGGAGVVGIGVGAYFGLRALGLKQDGDAECHGVPCTQRGLDLHSDARASATASTIAFGVGLAAVAVGAYLLLTRPRASLAKVAPTILGRDARLGLVGTW